MIKKEDSLNKRYFYKLFTNLFGIPIQFIIQAIVPRILGTVLYGRYSFLTNIFSQIIAFINSGTSIAYYNKLSSDLKNKKIIKFYFLFLITISSTISLGTLLLIIFDLKDILWPDQKIIHIFMAVLWAILNLLIGVINKTLDAYGLTAKAEIIKFIQKIFSLLVILILYFFWETDLTVFFLYNYLIFTFLIFFWLRILSKNGIYIFKNNFLSKNQIFYYFNYFWNYSNPLIVYSFLSMIFGIFDFWILQKYGGDIEQGYYGLAFRISSICFLFSSAMTPLITREFSIAFSVKSIYKMRYLFNKYIPLLYTITSIISIFLFVNAEFITQLVGGEEFEMALYTVALMSLYPIHQTYGQLSGSVFYATGKTKLYSQIGIFGLLLGFVLSLIFIGPNKYYALNLGSLGLALKMIILQFLIVNIQLYYNSKLLKIIFFKFLYHQFFIILILISIALISNLFSSIIINDLISFIVHGFIYLILIMILFYNYPKLAGINYSDIKKYKNLILKKNK